MHFASFWILPPAAFTALALAWPASGGAARLFWLMPAGLLLWTFIEYIFHRFVFHLALDKFHFAHHQTPTDRTFLLVRFPYVAAISAVVAAVLRLLAGDTFTTAGLMCGIWAGFLMYEFVHYNVHIAHTHGYWMTRRRRVHFDHHFRASHRNFGVTTSVWDFVFRTR